MECKYKEAGSLDQAVTELSSDRDGVPVTSRCTSVVLGRARETVHRQARDCAERKVRRDAEIAGVKEVLSILSGGESLINQKWGKKFLHRHSVA